MTNWAVASAASAKPLDPLDPAPDVWLVTRGWRRFMPTRIARRRLRVVAASAHHGFPSAGVQRYRPAGSQIGAGHDDSRPGGGEAGKRQG